jgi:hypothetical protein
MVADKLRRKGRPGRNLQCPYFIPRRPQGYGKSMRLACERTKVPVKISRTEEAMPAPANDLQRLRIRIVWREESLFPEELV